MGIASVSRRGREQDAPGLDDQTLSRLRVPTQGTNSPASANGEVGVVKSLFEPPSVTLTCPISMLAFWPVTTEPGITALNVVVRAHVLPMPGPATAHPTPAGACEAQEALRPARWHRSAAAG